MKHGLVIGKFMPLHAGHLALIHFAQQQCNLLTVLLCYTNHEPIAGALRQQWLENSFKQQPTITIAAMLYDENELPNTSVSSKEVSMVWAAKLKALLPKVDLVFSSEKYGDYLANYMHVQHICFDEQRNQTPIAASSIRSNPFKHWDFIANAAKPYFVKKIVLLGTESTGKSVLTERLAKHFNTAFVKEMARDIVEHTEECTKRHLEQIAVHHAREILKSIPLANKLLFIDTDISITQSYSLFLFNKELAVKDWIKNANHADLYFFLEPDCDFIQDGTRLPVSERNRLSMHHKKILEQKGINYISISGNWEDRFHKMINSIDETLLKNQT